MNNSVTHVATKVYYTLRFTIPLELITHSFHIMCHQYVLACGFGGLEVACWPLVPKFEGSHPAEAVGVLGRKNPLISAKLPDISLPQFHLPPLGAIA